MDLTKLKVNGSKLIQVSDTNDEDISLNACEVRREIKELNKQDYETITQLMAEIDTLQETISQRDALDLKLAKAGYCDISEVAYRRDPITGKILSEYFAHRKPHDKIKACPNYVKGGKK